MSFLKDRIPTMFMFRTQSSILVVAEPNECNKVMRNCTAGKLKKESILLGLLTASSSTVPSLLQSSAPSRFRVGAAGFDAGGEQWVELDADPLLGSDRQCDAAHCGLLWCSRSSGPAVDRGTYVDVDNCLFSPTHGIH